MSKNQIMLDYLSQCEGVRQLYFQYGDARDNAMQLVTSSVETATRAGYIDGSQPKKLDYSLIWYKALAFLPVVTNGGGQVNANVAELDDVQIIIDWIGAQNDAHNYPDLGEDCQVDAISCLHDVPQLIGIDASYSPPLAKYTFTVRVEYIDLSRCIFR